MFSRRLQGLSAAVIWVSLGFSCLTRAQQSRAGAGPTGKNAIVTAATGAAGVSSPASLLPEPPVKTARVLLQNGQLTVDAHNSELSQILGDIGRLTGMSISGLNGGKRIFGFYGPADPRSVIASLLDASGFNFLLVGGDAVPRQLVLAPEPKALPKIAKTPAPPQQDDYEDQYNEQDSADPY